MKTLYMMKGLPASGKTTCAKEMLKEFGYGNAKRVNKDELRLMLDDSHHSSQNEKFVLGVRDFIINQALVKGKHVIVDDTNLSPDHEKCFRKITKAHEAAFQVVDFTTVSPEECIKRDLIRPVSVGKDVILDMYEKYLKPKSQEYLERGLPYCIICDIDGTVAQNNGRGYFDWSRVGEDSYKEIVWEAVLGLSERLKCPIVFVSGRDGICWRDTFKWLSIKVDSPILYMRNSRDNRDDTIVKKEIYTTHIAGVYDVAAIFDDRPKVIRMWQELGFGDRIFNVGTGKEF